MGWVSIIALVILSLIAIVLILGLVAPRRYKVAEAIRLKRSAEVVFQFIKYLKNQEAYSVWAKMDPDMEHFYSGKDGQVGFIAGWRGNKKVGEGEQEIIAIDENDYRLETELRFIKPFESTSTAYMEVLSSGQNECEIVWAFEGSMKYPVNSILLYMDMKKMIGKDLRLGLQNLKDLMESGRTSSDLAMDEEA